MDNNLRIERLTELQGMLTHHHLLFKGKAEFYLGQWEGEYSKGCGYAACALGSACLHQPFIEQGLTVRNNIPMIEGEIAFLPDLPWVRSFSELPLMNLYTYLAHHLTPGE